MQSQLLRGGPTAERRVRLSAGAAPRSVIFVVAEERGPCWAAAETRGSSEASKVFVSVFSGAVFRGVKFFARSVACAVASEGPRGVSAAACEATLPLA